MYIGRIQGQTVQYVVELSGRIYIGLGQTGTVDRQADRRDKTE